MTRQRCPTKKKMFPTKEEADYQLELRKWWNFAWSKEDRVYQCPLCGNWHLTSQERRKKHEKQAVC